MGEMGVVLVIGLMVVIPVLAVIYFGLKSINSGFNPHNRP